MALLLGGAVFVGCGGELQAPSSALPRIGSDGSGPGGRDRPDQPDQPDRPDQPDNPDDPVPGVEPLRFACNPDGPAISQSLRRLSRSQYESAVRSLAEAAVGGPLSGGDDQQLADAIDSVPPDVLSGDEDYPTMVQAVGQSHVDAYQDVALAIADGGAAAAAGRCSGDCPGLLRAMADVAFRRPVTDDEADFLNSALSSGDDGDDLSRGIQLLAQSPDFLYHFEEGEDDSDEVGAFELANRLSFLFWNAPPDAELVQSAASGELLTPQGYEAQVDRLFASARTRTALHGFFEAWLELEEVPDMDENNDKADFAAFAGDDLPGPSLDQEMAEDLLAFVDHVVWTEDGSLADLFTRAVAVPPSAAMAAIYGVEAVGEPVELDPTQRAGILTRPALLAYNQAVTRPIIRGTLARVRLSCADLGLPDMMDDIQLGNQDPGETTRQKVEDLTEVPGSTCQGCHVFINAFGFALEQYDALGRYRSVERVFAEDGSISATHPIDPVADTPVDGEMRRFESAVDMSEALARSQDVERCFARHLFRHSFGRKDDMQLDGCTLEALRNDIHQGAPLSEVIRSIAFTPEFRRLQEDYE
ncbi:MAG: DUF1592 domain-containing protein [Myxococcota bacterium]